MADAVEAYEPVAHAFYEMLAAEERAEVEAAGVQSFTLSPEAEAAFVAHARSVHWEKVKADAPDSYDELRAAFPPE